MLVLGWCVGCNQGDGPVVYHVNGSVSFNGQPVQAGQITFEPASGNSGPAGVAVIKDGKFDTKLEGQGTVGGPHTAIIQGFDGNADPAHELPMGKPLFVDYRSSLDLPKEEGSQNFEVPAAAAERPQGGGL
jgi:hypothetical protein